MERLLRLFSRVGKRLRVKKLVALVLLVTGLSLLALSIYAIFRSPRETTYQLRLTAGSPYDTRNKLAEYLQEEGRSANLRFNLQHTEGSVEALGKVDRGEIDFALIQGGLRFPNQSNVRQVAALYVEPLHLVVRESLLEAAGKDLGVLNGLTINVSRPQSGTNLLATRALRFVGVEPKRQTHLSYRDILQRLQGIADAKSHKQRVALKQQLPDAFFVVATIPSQVIRQLVVTADYRLVPLRFGKAFSMISVEEETTDSDRINQLHLQMTSIPELTYSVSPPVPPESCETFGGRLVLIAHKNVPTEVILRLMPLIYEGAVNNLYHPPQPTEVLPEFQLHEGAIAYRDRNKPFLRADVIQLLQKIASIVGPFIGALIALYGFYRWRQVLRFTAFFRKIAYWQLVAKGIKTHDQLPQNNHARLQYLNHQLDDIQQQAINNFCQNYFRGEGVLYNLLQLIAEARSTFERELHDPTAKQAPFQEPEMMIDSPL